jgi:ceramide glucosyltransferase
MAHVSAVDWVFPSLAAAGAGFYLLSAAAVLLALRRGPPSTVGTIPFTILKPLREASPDLYENLASFCRLDYPEVQIILGLRSESDPAHEIARKVQADFPERDIRVLAEEPAMEGSPRVANLANILRRAKHDLLLISDDDARVEPHFLGRVAELLREGSTGAVTALYYARCRSPGSALHALTINLETLPFGLIAHLGWGGLVANGAALAVRRDALDRAGGFEAAADRPGDNLWLVRAIHRAGYRTELLSELVEMRDDPGSIAGFLRHQLRWDRTDRFLSPLLALGRILTQGLFWSLVYVAATAASELSLWTLLTVGALRLASAASIAIKLRCGSMMAWLWLVPVRDLLSVAIWVSSWFGRTIRFHGRSYRIEGGRRRVVPE